MAKKGFLFALLLVALVNSAWAYDFYAVCSTGQTLYYNITDASNHYVETTHPGVDSEPWTGYTKPTGSMAIPSEVSHNGVSYYVESIGLDSFVGCTGLTSVTIPSSVTTIQREAFDGCSSMNSIDIGNSVTTIGYRSFAGCNSLASLNLGSSVSSIAACAFFNCTALTSISFPNSLTTIGTSAFEYCGFSSLNLPSSVIHVGEDVFYHTPWYNNQPDGVVYAGLVACSYKGTMPSNTSIAIQSGTKSLARGLFKEKSGLVSVSLPNSLLVIGENTFWGCPGLTSITIPASVTYIGGNAFFQCGNLQTVNYNAQNCTYMGSSSATVFSGCSSFTTLNIGNGVVSIPDNAFYECSHLVNVPIPNSVTAIQKRAFYNCSSLLSITIGNDVSLIGKDAFWGCNSMTTINYNATNCSLGDEGSCPFPGTSPALTTLNIGNAVQTIPASMFSCCYHINVVSIPNSVHTIGRAAFYYCTGLSSLSIGNSVTSIGDEAFRNCSSISAISIPNSVTSIGERAFYYCSGATSLSIGNSVQTIPEEAFFSCSNISSLYIGNSVTSIESNAFAGCSSISSINIPNSVTSLGSYVFFNCYGATSLSIGNSVQTIPESAFWGCIGLSSVTIPNSVVVIGDNAFRACSGITTLQFGNAVTSIGSMAFMQCSSLASLLIGNTVTSIGEGAFWYCTGLTEIEVLSQTPPSCGASAFFGCYDKPLIVPCGCVSTYHNSPEWSYFTNIQQASGCSYQVTASANPSNGGTVQGAGLYNQGQLCTLVASSNTGFSFVKWTENGSQVSTSPTYSFTVNADRTLVAHFQHQQPSTYTITATANPANGGEITGTGTFTGGQVCTLTATPNSGFVFLKWTENGTQVSTNPTYGFTVNSNRTLVAHFQSQPNQYTITLSVNPTNGGLVSGGGTYSQGQACSVTANAKPSYSFANWTENGTQVSANSTYSFTVTGNRTLVANFEYSPNGYVINATAEPSSGGLVSGGGTYNQGQICNLTATPNPNYAFVKWMEGDIVVSTVPTYSFTVDGNRTLVAYFELQVYTISVSANPSYAGTVYGGGNYSAGITCHLIAVPNSGNTFLNWTEDNVVVSSDSDYTFVVTENRELVANFVDGIEEMASIVSVYPNPTRNKVYIEGNRLRKIEVYNAMGMLVVSQVLSDSHTELDLQHLSAGIYCLRVYTEDGAISQSIVKE